MTLDDIIQTILTTAFFLSLFVIAHIANKFMEKKK